MPRYPLAALRAGALLLALAVLPAAADAQRRDTRDDRDRDERQDDRRSRDDAFIWEGRVARGAWVTIRNINGEIRFEPADGDRVEVTATKRVGSGRARPNLADVRIEATRTGDDEANLLVCALFSDDATCDEEGYRGGRSRNNDGTQHIAVDFVVRLPRGVKVRASSVNGAVRVVGATSEVRASTVNGGIEAFSNGGPVSASTVNGSIRVRMASLDDAQELRYNTVNGSITVELPDDLDAELEMVTVNGGLNADYPITMQGRINPRHIRARIGSGGPRLSFRTVNGSVYLRKSRGDR